jgi:hypothetical protein
MLNLSQLHSVVFVKPYSLYDRHRFLRSYKLKPIKRVHSTPNTFRYRLINPDEFKSFSTKKIHSMVRDGSSSGIVELIIGYR